MKRFTLILLALGFCLPVVVYAQVDSFDYYKRQAEKGDERSQYAVAGYYISSLDFALAKHWLSKAAGKNYPPALTQLAMMYIDGTAGAVDYSVARQYLQQAVDSGSSDAEVDMGYLYSNGLGVPRDSVIAEKYYRSAAAKDNSFANATLGMWYFNGVMGLPLSYELALPYIRNAANKGVPRSQYELGLLYQHGWGGLKADTNNAFKWYGKAADQVYMPAMNNYAWLCFLKKENLPKGIQYIEFVVQTAPEIKSIDTYAALLSLAGEYDEALKWQKKAMDINANRNGGYIERYGDILCKAGKEKDAMRYWKESQKIPGHSINLITKIMTGKCE